MKNQNTSTYSTPIQLKLPVDLERIIEISDAVYTFNEVMEHMDLHKYFAEKDCKTGRPAYDPEKLLKIILFAFMEHGYCSLREIEKLCKTDIRFLWLLDEAKAPSFMTIDNFINQNLKCSIEDIFTDINRYIFEKEHIDLTHTYIDGTKIEANANKYTWVWKKSSLGYRQNVFVHITQLLNEINETILAFRSIKFGTRTEYAIEYVESILETFLKTTGFSKESFVHGKGKRKTKEQKLYERLEECCQKLKKYSEHIKICGDKRNSYSKTDQDATFMRVKKDYVGNDQLLPAYNVQFAVCDEFIAQFGIFQYASDMDCFQPLMDAFYHRYGVYPKYPVADAGYGSYNNYLYCQEHGMEKFMKFTMFEKESKNKAYRNNPYRACNFPIDEEGYMVCPNGKRFHYLCSYPVKGNRYGRTEEYYQCENCEGCPHREKCHKSAKNRIVRINEELTQFHKEVLNNLNCIHGALLRMNRSIQSEGAFGVIKWDRSYKRFRRRGLESTILEIGLICCGFNLHKYHLKKQTTQKAA